MPVICAFVIPTEGPQGGTKRSASSSLGMKAFFTLSGAEGLDSASWSLPRAKSNGLGMTRTTNIMLRSEFHAIEPLF